MSGVIWWIGAFHVVAYAGVGMAGISWWGTEYILRRLKLGRAVVLFLMDRARKLGRWEG